MPGRSMTEAIHLLRQFIERFRERKINLHMVFIDLEKAYDKMPREVLWWTLMKKRVPIKYIVAPRSGGYGDVTTTYIRRSEIPSRIYTKH